MFDTSTLRQGDYVTFSITGVRGLYRGLVLNPNGYQGAPEVRVTQEWNPSTQQWQAESGWPILKGDDFIIDEKV